MLSEYPAFKAAGGFQAGRPLSVREALEKATAQIIAAFNGGSGAQPPASMGLNWGPVDDMLQRAPCERAAQPARDPEDIQRELRALEESVARGPPQPAGTHSQLGGVGSVGSGDADDHVASQLPQQLRQQLGQADRAEPGSGADEIGASDPAGPCSPAAQQPPELGTPARPGVEATRGAALAGPTADDLLNTPLGQHSRAQIQSRTVHSRTPGGFHTLAFWGGGMQGPMQGNAQTQVRPTGQRAPPEQALLQQLALQPAPLQAQEPLPLPPPQQPVLPPQQQQQVLAHHELAGHAMSAPQAANVPPTSMAMSLGPYEDLMGRMGMGDPAADIMNPDIRRNPAVSAALAPPGQPSQQHSAQPLAVLAGLVGGLSQELRELRHEVADLRAGKRAESGAPGTGAAPATRDGGDDSPAGAAPSSAPCSGNAQASAKARGAAGKDKRFFPSLSFFTTLEHMAQWYSREPDTNSDGRSREQMERDGDHAWRGGHTHNRQRWSELALVLRKINAHAVQLTSQRQCVVGLVEAAKDLDAQRAALPNPNPKKAAPGMSVPQYMEHLRKHREHVDADDSGDVAP